MTDTLPWTIGRLLTWTTDYLRQHGSETPRLDAEVLLAYSKNCQRIQLYTSFETEPDEAVRSTFRELVRKRAAGTPVAYLVGHKEFYSLDFEVTSDVLIPRCDTEYAVLQSLDLLKKMRETSGTSTRLQVVDVGTGSGCISVAIAKHFEACDLTSIDLSPRALDVARRNADRHGMADRIRFVESDLFSAWNGSDTMNQGTAFREGSAEDAADHSLSKLPETVDLIVSNPPYVSPSEFSELSPEVRDHEPRLALVADRDGMAIIERLILDAPKLLRVGGYLVFELSPMIAPRVESQFSSLPQWDLERIVRDSAGHSRIAVARLLQKDSAS